MCGIVGILSYGDNSPKVDKSELLKIRDYMTNRGPDDCGIFLSEDNRIGLGHRRLSIIDTSENGKQPMMSNDGNVLIVFNGEIYNFRQIRRDLENNGYTFFSNSDTEVLIQLYKQKKLEMVNDLEGMYSFILYDKKEETVFIVRDPLGIKPLYYSDDGNVIRVASQVKALISGGYIQRDMEPAGQVGFFLWGYVPEPFTLYKNIHAVPAGNIITINISKKHNRARRIYKRCFCNVSSEIESLSNINLHVNRTETKEHLRKELRATVDKHLVSDVPVGIFLSSGIDSTTLAATAKDLHHNFGTITLGFKEFEGTIHNEVPLAEAFARKYNLQHQTIWLTQDDFLEAHDDFIKSMDQPTIDGINSYFISLAAKRAGLKVALSGIGADELFGGYPSFKQIPTSVNLFKHFRNTPCLGKALRGLLLKLLPSKLSPKYAGVFEYGGEHESAYLLRRCLMAPWELSNHLDESTLNAGLNRLETENFLKSATDNIHSAYLKVTALEMSAYMKNQLLRDCDWASMAHSLEIRVPYADMTFIKSIIPYTNGLKNNGKQILGQTPQEALPDEILARPKTGFSVPIHEWQTNRLNTHRGLTEWATHIYSKFD